MQPNTQKTVHIAIAAVHTTVATVHNSIHSSSSSLLNFLIMFIGVFDHDVYSYFKIEFLSLRIMPA